MEEKSLRDHEEKSCRRDWAIMDEPPCSSNHARATMKEKSWRTSHGQEIMASRRHSGCNQEVPRDPQEALRGTQEAPRPPRRPGKAQDR
jgi:hypothetical protein